MSRQTCSEGETKANFISSLSSPSPTSIPIPEKIWIDIEPREHKRKDSQSFPNSKRMIAPLKHPQSFWTLKKEVKSAFPNSVYWLIRMWMGHLQKGGRYKKIFQYGTDFTGGTNSLPPSYPRSFGRILWIRLYRITCWYPTISSS